MKFNKLFQLHLRAKDIFFIAILFIMLPLTYSLFQSYNMMVVAIVILLCLFIGIQIEIYRRFETILLKVKERYLVMDIVDVARTRRSIRSFSIQPVTDEDIRKMLDAARWAPNGGQTEPWKFIVIRNRELLNRMEEIIRLKIYAMPRAATFKNRWHEGTLFLPARRLPLRSLKRISLNFTQNQI